MRIPSRDATKTFTKINRFIIIRVFQKKIIIIRVENKKKFPVQYIISVTNLSDPYSTFDIESLSISLDVTLRSFASCSPSLVQLTGTKIDHESNAIGTKILSL